MNFKLVLFCVLYFLSLNSFSFEVDNFTKRNSKIKDSEQILNAEVNRKLEQALIAIQEKYSNTCDREVLKTYVWGQLGASPTDWGGLVGSIESFAETNPLVEKVGKIPIHKSIYKNTITDSFRSTSWWAEIFRKLQITVGKALDKLSGTSLKIRIKAHEMSPNFFASPNAMVDCGVPKKWTEQLGKVIKIQKDFLLNNSNLFMGVNPITESTPPLPTSLQKFTEKFTDLEKSQFEEHLNCLTSRMFAEMTDAEIDQIHNNSMKLNGSGLQSTIKIHNTWVGTDKLGHFFDQGGEYYDIAYTENQGEAEALNYGLEREEGSYGLLTTSIKSYADLSANYYGMVFWRELLDSDYYFKCENGQFKIHNKFEWNRYVNSSWDEGINCSEFIDEEMDKGVQKNLANLNMNCPVEVNKCQDLKLEIPKKIQNHIIGPKCLMQMESEKKETKGKR